MDQLIAYGKVSRGQLGVSVETVTADIAKRQSIAVDQGALVANVESGSPAQKAGIEKGDVIIAVNGTAIDTSAQLRNRIGLTKPGTSVQLDSNRDGNRKTLAVVLAEAKPPVQKTQFDSVALPRHAKRQKDAILLPLVVAMRTASPAIPESTYQRWHC